MITGAVRSTEISGTDQAVTDMLADPALAFVDDPEEFNTRARVWLNDHYASHSAGFADFVIQKAWAQHTARQGRLEISAPELGVIAALLQQAPPSPAAESLTAKINAVGARLGLGNLVPPA